MLHGFRCAIALFVVGAFSGSSACIRYHAGMEILKNILVVLHILSFAVVFGATLAQLPNVKHGKAEITKGVFHGSLGLLVTGLALVGMLYAVDIEPNNAKIGAKTLVLLAIIALVVINRKKAPVSGGVLGAIAGLSAVNVALAVLW